MRNTSEPFTVPVTVQRTQVANRNSNAPGKSPIGPVVGQDLGTIALAQPISCVDAADGTRNHQTLDF